MAPKYTQQQAAAAKAARQKKAWQDAVAKKMRTDAANKAKWDAAVKARMKANAGVRDVNDPTSPQQNANLLGQIQKTFADMGLPGLFTKVQELYRQGIKDQDSILFELRNTDEYKQRFAANAKRVQQGLPELTPKAYIELEKGYQEAMQKAMLPSYFYDDPKKDFQKLIEGNISVLQVQDRVNWAKQATVEADPALVKQLRDMYGINQADITAYFLDPEHTQEKLNRQQAAAQFNASAARAGQQFSTAFAEEAGTATSGNRQASDQVFNNLTDEFQSAAALNGVWDTNLTAEDLARDAFNMDGAGEARVKKNRLASQERAAFGGRSSTASSTLADRKDI